MSCNCPLAVEPRTGWRVSIPIGFSNELQQRHLCITAPAPLPVSIPIGFSNELQRTPGNHSPVSGLRFQSLSGFPMSCNLPVGDPGMRGGDRFNPYRVFQ